MCGIVGIFDSRGRSEINRELLQRMNDSQIHRGPDGSGLFLQPGIGLGHRRLSIIDLAGGAQPMQSQDQSIVITYNGEVYNFAQIRSELEQKGYNFTTRSDTEVVLYSWKEWGEDCLEKLRGMFAFAIWDKNREELFIARDRLGIKPLYYTFTGCGRLVFGSELKSVLEYNAVAAEINPQAVADYFALGYVPDPKSIYKNIHKLPPGYFLKMRRGEPSPRLVEYWDVPFNVSIGKSEEQIKGELIDLLKEAISGRMIADVPLGAFLSGGVDSSGVVALMSELSDSAVETCSIGFDSGSYNESEYAAAIAEKYQTKHHLEIVSPDSYSLIDTLASVYDEPYADSSAMPTYTVCQLARKHVTVALSGDGADELMSGYRRHRLAYYENNFRNKIPNAIRKPIFGTLGKVYPKLDRMPQFLRAKSTFQSLAMDEAAGYLHAVSYVPQQWRDKLFSKDFKQKLGGYRVDDFFRNQMYKCPHDHPLSRIQYADIKTYLAGDILTKVDRASMAHSLEVRVPIIDHLFVEWISSIEPQFKLKDNIGKYIFKKSLEGRVPDDILYRPKMGFSMPLAEWFRGALKEKSKTALLNSTLGDSGIFNMDFIDQALNQHQSGKRDYTAMLWSLLMFDAFSRNGDTTKR